MSIITDLAMVDWSDGQGQAIESLHRALRRLSGEADNPTRILILDVGPRTAKIYADYMHDAGTVVWNGPLGVFEFDQFGAGTHTLAEAIAKSDAFSVVGGGDSLAALDKYDLADRMSYLSTGGGAFLEFIEGKTLPAVAVLDR